MRKRWRTRVRCSIRGFDVSVLFNYFDLGLSARARPRLRDCISIARRNNQNGLHKHVADNQIAPVISVPANCEFTHQVRERVSVPQHGKPRNSVSQIRGPGEADGALSRDLPVAFPFHADSRGILESQRSPATTCVYSPPSWSIQFALDTPDDRADKSMQFGYFRANLSLYNVVFELAELRALRDAANVSVLSYSEQKIALVFGESVKRKSHYSTWRFMLKCALRRKSWPDDIDGHSRERHPREFCVCCEQIIYVL